MTTMNDALRARRSALALCMVASTVLVACPSGDDDSRTTSAGGSESSSTGTDPSASQTSNGDTVGATDTGSSESTSGGAPDGADCEANEDCRSGFCFAAGIVGSFCGECLTDDDCEFGCGVPNPLSDPPTGSVCEDGTLGSGCQTDAACRDELLCAEIISVPAIVTASTCSECLVDADCDEGLVCNADYDVLNVGGSKTCVTPGSVADGRGCDLEGSGAAACEHYCAPGSISGFVDLGVCSPCIVEDGENLGCAEGETCVEPEVDPLDRGLVPGFCK